MHMKNLNADLKDGMTDLNDGMNDLKNEMTHLKNKISYPDDDIAHPDDYNLVHLFLLLSIIIVFTRFTCVLLWGKEEGLQIESRRKEGYVGGS